MNTWVIIVVASLMSVGYLSTAIATDPTASPVTGQQFELWALYFGDTAIPIALILGIGLIAVAFYMRVHLDPIRAETGAGDS